MSEVHLTAEQVRQVAAELETELETNTNFPNLFGLSVEQFSERIDYFHVAENATADELQKAYQELCSYDSVANCLSNSIGLLARKKGTILNRLYHVDDTKRKDSLLKQKEWTEFRKANCKESDDTLENYRHIAERFPLCDRAADGLGVVDMLQTIADEKPPKNRGGSGDKKTNKKFRVSDVDAKMVQAQSALDCVSKGLPKAVDLCENVAKSRSILKDAEGALRTLEAAIKAVRGKIKQVKAAIKKYEELHP
jgi:hypothetical protein